MKKKFEVYMCVYKGKVIYVGYGTIGRHKHCISGTSHNYKLNEFHFTGERDLITVSVVGYFTDSAEAKRYESELIEKWNPEFNISETAKAKLENQQKGWLENTSDTFRNTKVVDN